MDEHSEPTADALARAAQTLAVAISVVEALARLRAQRAHDQADAADQASSAIRATKSLRHASSQLIWTQAFDDNALRRMSASEMLQAWRAADSYRDLDPAATQAAEHLERRLRAVHPEAMAAYDDALDRRERRVDAMHQATFHFCGEFGLDPVGSPLFFAASAAAQHHAASASRPDNPRTARIDEGTLSQQAAAKDYGTAAAEQARALTALAMPVPIDEAMVTAPQAARRMLALPAAPTARPRTERRGAPTVTATNR